MDLRRQINETLKEKRPNLSESSARTYSSLLLSIYNKLEGEDGLENH
jgi:hypothetical protein